MELSKRVHQLKRLIFPMTTKKAIHWIALIGIVVFFNMLFNNFVYDDIKYVQNNAEIQSFSFDKIIGPSLFNGTGQFRPIPAFYYTFMYSLFSDYTFFYHFAQLILHISICILIFIFFKKFFSPLTSFFITLIFLVHPIQVESVSYLSSFGNPLFFLFGLIALLISFQKKLPLKHLALVCLFLLLSFLTKETGVLFIFIIGLYSLLYSRKHLLPLGISSATAVLLYLDIRFGIGKVYLGIFETIPMHQLTLLERSINFPAIFYYYLSTCLFPSHLAILQNWIIRSVTFSQFYFPLMMSLLFLVLTVGVGSYVYRQKNKFLPTYIFFTLWFLSGMAMHLQIIPLDMTVADRWFYFPFVGLLGMLAVMYVCLQTILERVGIHKKDICITTVVLFTLILVLLSLRTMVRNTDWRNERDLLLHDIAVSDDYIKEDMLGQDLLTEQKYDQAIKHMSKSVGLNPVALNTNNLGLMYQMRGEYTKAKEMYLKSLEFEESSNSLFAYTNISYLYVYYDDPKRAIPILRNKVLPTYRTNAEFWSLLAIAYYKAGQRNNAIETIKYTYSLSPTQEILKTYNLMQENTPAHTFQLNSASFLDHIPSN